MTPEKRYPRLISYSFVKIFAAYNRCVYDVFFFTNMAYAVDNIIKCTWSGVSVR